MLDTVLRDSELDRWDIVPKSGVDFPVECVERSATHQGTRLCDRWVAPTLQIDKAFRIAKPMRKALSICPLKFHESCRLRALQGLRRKFLKTGVQIGRTRYTSSLHPVGGSRTVRLDSLCMRPRSGPRESTPVRRQCGSVASAGVDRPGVVASRSQDYNACRPFFLGARDDSPRRSRPRFVDAREPSTLKKGLTLSEDVRVS
jgi:hypothetical protein